MRNAGEESRLTRPWNTIAVMRNNYEQKTKETGDGGVRSGVSWSGVSLYLGWAPVTVVQTEEVPDARGVLAKGC